MAKLNDIKMKYSEREEISYEEYKAARETMDSEEFKSQYSWALHDQGGNVYYKMKSYNTEDAMLLFMEDIRKEVDATKRYTRNTWYFAVALIILNLISVFVACTTMG